MSPEQLEIPADGSLVVGRTYVIDPINGEIPMNSPVDPLTREKMRVEVLEQDRLGLVEELMKARRSEAALRSMLAKQGELHPQMGTARLIARYYVHRLGKTKAWKFGEKRQKAVLARLKEGYEPVFICRAIDGLAIGYNTNRDTGVIYDDLELVCRDEVNLDRFHQLAERNKAPSLISNEWEKKFGGINADDLNMTDTGQELTASEPDPTLEIGAE